MGNWEGPFLNSCKLIVVSCNRECSMPVLLLMVSLPSQEYVHFFKHRLGRSVSWGDRMEFINGWYILLIVSDVFTIVGSFIKIGIESKVKRLLMCCCWDCSLPQAEVKTVSGTVINGDWCCDAESFVLWCVRHPAGNLHFAGVGGSHPLPQLLPEIQCTWKTHAHTNTHNSAARRSFFPLYLVSLTCCSFFEV